MDSLPCPKEDVWLAFLDGTLGAEQTHAHELHLDSCAACRRLTAAIVRSRVSSTRFPSEPVSPGGATEDLKGARLGRYLLLERLGEGGMGLVYLAYDPELDRRVAIKLIRRGLSDRAAVEHERLLFEARALAKVSHPHVLRVHDVGSLDGQIFVAMELVTGPSLRAWSDGRSWRELLHVLLAAGRGLQAAHDAGLVHGDFKPDNVLLTASSVPLVTDFGLASSIDQNGRAQVWGGTPAYMAPELTVAQRTSPASDQFSFCVTALELLEQTRGTPARLLERLRRGRRAEPSERFDSMGALLDSLEAVPRQERWRRVAAGVTAVAVLVSASVVISEKAKRVQCDASGDLSDLWDPARSASIQRAFAATQVPNAEAVWRGLQTELDRVALAWSSQATASCRAAPWWGPSPDDVRRQTCVASLRGEFEALTRELAKADEETVRQGARAVALLTPAQRCEGLTSATTFVTPSGASERQLLEAMAQLSLGHAKPAVQTLGALVHSIDPTHAVAPLAWERYVWALQRSESYEAADAALLEALAVQERAQRDDLLVRTAAGYALGLADRRTQLEQAERWVRFADAAHSRVTNGSDELVALIASARTQVLLKSNRSAEAELTAREWVRGVDVSPNASAARSAEALEALANVLVFEVKLDEAEGVARRSLAQWTLALGPDHVALLPILQVLGSLELGRGKAAAALAWTDQALGLARKTHSPGSVVIARLMISRTVDSMQLGKLEHVVDEARDAFEVLSEKQGAHSPEALTARAILGSAQLITGDLESAVANCSAALQGMERLGTEGDRPSAKREIANTLGCLSSSLLGLNRPREALPYLERTVAMFEGKDQVPVQRAYAKLELAKCLVALHDPAQTPRARQLARESMQIFESLEMKEDADEARTLSASVERHVER